MAKILPPDFNWQSSRPHLGLLRIYRRPKPPARQEYAENGLGEPSLVAIERLLKAGALVECDVLEKIEAKFRASELKELLKQRNLKVSGDRAQLVARLMESDPGFLPGLVRDFRLIKCSKLGAESVEKFERMEEEARKAAVEESHRSLLKGDAKSAYAAHLKFKRAFSEYSVNSSSYTVERLIGILKATPPRYKNLSPDKLAIVRAATGLSELWYGIDVEPFLGEALLNDAEEQQRAINFFKQNGDFRQEIEQNKEWMELAKLSFDENDVDLCERCLAFNGKTFKLSEIPEFPLADCKNPSGCLPQLDPIDEDRNESGGPFEESESEGPAEALRKLKQLLDEGLIEKTEYDTKKAEILKKI